MASAKRNRTAGHGFELEARNEFRTVGYPLVETSRFTNKLRDHQKVDLSYPDESVQGRFPFNVQCKCSTTLGYVGEMQKIPEIPGVKNVILHKHTKKAGTKFMTKGSYAFMNMSDFFNLLEEINYLKSKLKTYEETQSN